jgi:hypothetical protein
MAYSVLNPLALPACVEGQVGISEHVDAAWRMCSSLGTARGGVETITFSRCSAGNVCVWMTGCEMYECLKDSDTQ